MAYSINDLCISCGACENECPVSCISSNGTQYNINSDICVECGACVSVCPVNAIHNQN